MTAKNILDKINNWLAPWDRCDDIPESEQIEIIQEKINAGILDLYTRLIKNNDIMEQFENDKTAILYELITCDAEQLQTYKENFL